MAKRAFYRQYRPRSLSEVRGQPHITQTLENALKEGSISHAYLFSGPRGIGKTSVARIFAHAINDIPYEDDSLHLDIIEIDAASNRRIDEIRDLRDKIGITPTSSKYKVYIIDEVHMLTKEAFSALLKTLEEPPQHAVFILATTEAHRLPDTILSRTQRHTFKPVTVKDLAKHLSLIAKKEKISIDGETLNLLATHASGSYRDGLSLLDQLATSHNKSIDLEDVRESLGLAPSQQVNELLMAVRKGESRQLLKLLESTLSGGVSAPMLAKQIIAHLQSRWVEGEGHEAQLLKMTDDLLAVQGANEPGIKMTVVLLEACLGLGDSKSSYPSSHAPKNNPIKKSPDTSASQKANSLKSATQNEKLEDSGNDVEVVDETKLLDKEAWERVLNKIQSTNNSLYAVLRMAHAGLNGSHNVVILTFQFPFHRKQVAAAKNKKIVEDALSQEVGQRVALKMQVDKDLQIAPASAAGAPQMTSDDDNGLSNVIDIMGGGEVVSI